MADKHIATPIIQEIDYNNTDLQRLKDPLLLTYPTVYVIHDDSSQQFTLYVGETTDIKRRTIEHMDIDPNTRDDWHQLAQSTNVKMIVIGHEHFNKSMTLDIENQLMLYLSGTKAVKRLNNRRTNPQGLYYPIEERNQIFSKIWRKLHLLHRDIFPVERVIRNSALFKASPFHELTEEQKDARQLIFERITQTLQNQQTGQLILVEGDAGSGKTVLLSTLFYEMVSTLNQQGQALQEGDSPLSAALLINHDEQLKVYQDIMAKLGITNKNDNQVDKPTRFINNHTVTEPVDVVLVDEAHLMWTQGKQSYRGKNQLYDLLNRARIVIAVFDRHQVLTTTGYWEDNLRLSLEDKAAKAGNLIHLKQQLRIQASETVTQWLDTFVHQHRVTALPTDSKYDLRVFKSPADLYHAISERAADEDHGLSRMLATFDWPYKDEGDNHGELWQVKIGNWSMPWNLQLNAANPTEKRRNRTLAWAEQKQTINEIGSTFTIQGFDLNYAGVIIGPSIKYRNGKVIFDPSASENKRAKNRRTMADGSKQVVADELLENELNVLLTRGVHGLYIFAVDPELQQALMKAQQQEFREKMVAENSDQYD